ncbi:MAG: tRNA (adenosine(37)-N6)-threonylcarbamoyltransferase complex dimerization subunit type 1 TsaB [Candidatus Sedimenticola endophacoides]|uniref:tRNA threonylcarbamoyladenosine biosynthesis protein TsaB n=1 Tax=Candidatus Sedimenticola endophacoides TaxID=2548426 RepID=A0A657PQ14_9GAMM|nr:MAG: tRNA (adenosine(37)-N6)-threonylcarbamoyltransferase complex dimerization subunit type 1 TsaB [Candidatus Sedimenticola endophacoides]OQX35058.1 MAG: tRNA (adenosine(37)-N6)-threonylcarbamoyltransferase complex dimerization subunit type 1 TsaB [Candidatus Sedimenticola endophacoides]OQX40399.1 MAG: tRNA (adenosine(37)-N6)-threonylcarbamoyltransferase complex dimerization subunit type 1 TsaB [Candidatus Sedimenticola endophacoides]OQX40932.1 MAG: tRNA (adenosine(37)-N6)-threonylcarbamoylt
MKLLAIETATEACSAALYIDGEVELRYAVQARRHSELILPMMEALLAGAGLTLSGLDALAFGRGPGAFTGVRIATGVVQGAAFAADLPVLPVSTLAALAQRCHREQGARQVLAAYDARMGELYWGGYQAEAGVMRVMIPDQVATPQDVELPRDGLWQGAGTGWAAHGEVLRGRLGPRLGGSSPALYCSAEDVARLAADGWLRGEAVTAEQALPVYLRDQVASKPASPVT